MSLLLFFNFNTLVSLRVTDCTSIYDSEVLSKIMNEQTFKFGISYFMIIKFPIKTEYNLCQVEKKGLCIGENKDADQLCMQSLFSLHR